MCNVLPGSATKLLQVAGEHHDASRQLATVDGWALGDKPALVVTVGQLASLADNVNDARGDVVAVLIAVEPGVVTHNIGSDGGADPAWGPPVGRGLANSPDRLGDDQFDRFASRFAPARRVLQLLIELEALSPRVVERNEGWEPVGTAGCLPRRRGRAAWSRDATDLKATLHQMSMYR